VLVNCALPLVNAIVQCLLLGVVVWYAFETRKIRKVSQRQVEASQEQVEAAQKPCLAFSTAPRPFQDAVLEMEGTNAAMMLRCPEGQAEVENVGSGPAVNVRYNLTPTNPASTLARPSGYLIGMRPGEKFLTPIPRGILQGNEWKFLVTYESLSGRRYQTRIIVNNLILTEIEFGPLSGSYSNSMRELMKNGISDRLGCVIENSPH